ncbi:hypothetical protein D7V94_21515 [Parablautia intestinalis]|uniref:Uncharacterized protein n=1 Tax=Parablautia intestinalis TaxID=2320100 RepID=A0A3A9A5W9_9FIRM|nr:hypothetical protein [Parablautia intestinalis]RKI87130.1 hypothetical protein D7V94_21515 [Parablautia intestinalis]
MDIKSIQTTFSKIVEAAGENGVTDEKMASEIVKKHKVSNFEAMNALQEINKNLEAGIALEYDKGVFFYRKLKQPEQSTQKPEPEESTAVRLAKKLARQRMGEKERLEILKHYM